MHAMPFENHQEIMLARVACIVGQMAVCMTNRCRTPPGITESMCVHTEPLETPLGKPFLNRVNLKK
jgi:hypothetical protein